MTKAEAIAFLTQRYEQQCLSFPTMRNDISLALYLGRNTAVLLRNRNKVTA
jgi:hypothetical protein